MFKQVFRVAFVTLIWKQYKQLIVSTLLLFFYLFLVGSVHSDFLTHSQLQNNAANTGYSFVYKWLAFAVGVSAYFVYHYARSKHNQRDKSHPKIRQKELIQELDDLADTDDPFANIRTRKKLRGRADFMIDDEQ